MDSQDTNKNLTIFQNVANIIATTEFNEANAEFFKLHSHKFSDDEENKHEYMQLFEEYLSLAEKAIESKLKEEMGVTDDEMLEFYSTFEDNRKLYEADNSDAFDTLFTMINFDAFKKQMVTANRGMIDIESTQVNAADKNTFKKLDINEQW